MQTIEAEVGEIVKIAGGTCLDETLASARSFSNADYHFKNFNLVAELKSLNDDTLKSKTHSAKYDDFLLRLADTSSSDHQATLVEFTAWVTKALSKTIGDHIKKANKQIRETKEYLKVNDAGGVLFLVIDGNLSAHPHLVLDIAKGLLRPRYKGIAPDNSARYRSIDGVFLFSVNTMASAPAIIGFDDPAHYNLRHVRDGHGMVKITKEFQDQFFESHNKYIAGRDGLNLIKYKFKSGDAASLLITDGAHHKVGIRESFENFAIQFKDGVMNIWE